MHTLFDVLQPFRPIDEDDTAPGGHREGDQRPTLGDDRLEPFNRALAVGENLKQVAYEGVPSRAREVWPTTGTDESLRICNAQKDEGEAEGAPDGGSEQVDRLQDEFPHDCDSFEKC